jgi:hypothetical protein
MATGIGRVEIHTRTAYLNVLRAKLRVWLESGFKDRFGDELRDKNIVQAFASAAEGMQVRWVIKSMNNKTIIKYMSISARHKKYVSIAWSKNEQTLGD